LSSGNSTDAEAYEYFMNYYRVPQQFYSRSDEYDERERKNDDEKMPELVDEVEEVDAEDAGAEGPPAQQPRERRGVVNRVLRNLFMGQGPDERRAIDEEAIARRERERAEGEAERGARRPRPGRLGRELDAVGFGTTEKKKRGRPKKSENKRKNKK
jgi:hypothetical protein